MANPTVTTTVDVMDYGDITVSKSVMNTNCVAVSFNEADECAPAAQFDLDKSEIKALIKALKLVRKSL